MVHSKLSITLQTVYPRRSTLSCTAAQMQRPQHELPLSYKTPFRRAYRSHACPQLSYIPSLRAISIFLERLSPEWESGTWVGYVNPAESPAILCLHMLGYQSWGVP